MNHPRYSQESMPGPPLDYSFKCINTIEDVLLEEPRIGVKAIKHTADGKVITQSIRLNNNTLTELSGFRDMIAKVLADPTQLRWIDLSFNDLSTIDTVITRYQNMYVLNLHANSIKELSEVDKLAYLPNLKSLTLHGNPIESEKGYRSYVISLLPGLKSFDFSGVTKQDRANAEAWKRMTTKSKRMKKKKKD
ncbi:leucine-rich repeat-containing protein 51 isoform X2 [Ambystoma mexicanum]